VVLNPRRNVHWDETSNGSKRPQLANYSAIKITRQLDGNWHVKTSTRSPPPSESVYIDSNTLIVNDVLGSMAFEAKFEKLALPSFVSVLDDRLVSMRRNDVDRSTRSEFSHLARTSAKNQLV
jgi:hypothetical protein